MNARRPGKFSGDVNSVAAIDQQIDLLAKQYPELIDKALMHSKEVIEASEKLSEEIIARFRQHLSL